MIHNPRDSFSASALLVVALLLGATACSGEASSGSAGPAAEAAEASTSTSASASTPAADDDVTVISPGRPGETASTGPAVPAPPAGWNDADAVFVQMMVPHHRQALEMADLAEQHAVDARVRRLAERIAAAQGPEVQLMTAWLAEEDLESTEMGEMGDMGGMAMEGMLTGDQMSALAAARGVDFDRLFLQGMVAHHQGAVDMASDVAVAGTDVLVAELAADVTLTQTAEIERMRSMLADLAS